MARPAVRVRLTLLYSALFGGSGLLLAGLSYWLVREHLERTARPPELAAMLGARQAQYAPARAEQTPPRREPADLAAAARLAAEQTRLEAARRGITLELALTPAPLEGDARLVERLVGNLVENAVRHGAEGSRALVWTGRDGR